jgi:lipopolysaccharide transport system permease protein
MKNTVVLEAGKTDREYFKDLWRFRELFYVLAWRDVSVRYKQTAIGVAWAILRPAISTVVFTLVFGKMGKFPSEGVPYPLLVMTGMLPWQLFSAGLTESGASLTGNANLITKVYFPRLIIPGSALVTSLVDFSLSLVMLGSLMAFYGVAPGWQVLCLPFFVLLAMVAAGGIGAWISALNVKYRDFAFVVPFITQLGLYASPVAFSTGAVPQKWRLLFALNPMVAIIEGFRWSVLGRSFTTSWTGLAFSVLVIVTIAIGGFSYFRRTERSFADVI